MAANCSIRDPDETALAVLPPLLPLVLGRGSGSARTADPCASTAPSAPNPKARTSLASRVSFSFFSLFLASSLAFLLSSSAFLTASSLSNCVSNSGHLHDLIIDFYQKYIQCCKDWSIIMKAHLLLISWPAHTPTSWGGPIVRGFSMAPTCKYIFGCCNKLN